MALKDKTQRFGTTEISDPCFHLELFDNLYEGNLIITKRLTDKLIEKIIENKEKIILHCTVTGMGGSKIEPLVPKKEWSHDQVKKLIEKGFPVEQIVLRVDPIIPTEKGTETALSVIDLFKDLSIKRVRISFLDAYSHVLERFKENMINPPYETFNAPESLRIASCQKLLKKCNEIGAVLEMCGEPSFKANGILMQTLPCLSQKDVDILGLTDKIKLEGNKDARKLCGCSSNKTELIKDKPHQCNNKCLYCFWRTDKKQE